MTGAPPSIRWFAWAWLAQMLVTLIYQLLEPASVVGGLLADSASPPPPALVATAITLRLAISALALWLVVWRRSNFGRWLAVLLALFRLRGALLAVALVAGGQWQPALWLAGSLAALAAAWLLFRADSREWVRGAGAARG